MTEAVGETEVRSALEQLGVPFEVIDCDPDLADTAAFCAHYGYSLDDSANTITTAGCTTLPMASSSGSTKH